MFGTPTAVTLAGLITLSIVGFAAPSAFSQTTTPPPTKPAEAPAVIKETVKAAVDVAAAPTVSTMLDRAAAGAEVVVVIPSLSGLSQAIATFGGETGLDRMAPEFADTLGAFKRQMGWLEGVDDEGAILIVVSKLGDAIAAELTAEAEAPMAPAHAVVQPVPADGSAPKPAVDEGPADSHGDADHAPRPRPEAVMLVPVKDYKAFVAQLGGDPAADTTAVTFQNLDGRENDGYARLLDGYAVMSDKLETVEAYTPAKNGQAMTDAMGGLVSEYLNGGDSLILINVAALAEPLNLAVDRAVEEMKAGMDRPNAGLPAGLNGTVASMMNLYQQTARTLIDGTDTLLLSLDFNDDGLGLTTSAQMKDGSQLAGFFTPTPTPTPVNKNNNPLNKPKAAEEKTSGGGGGALLASLPDQPYIYAASIDAGQFALDKVIDQVTAALGDADQGGGGAGVLTLYRDSIAMMKDTQGVASVFYAPAPEAMMAGGFYTSLTVYDVADADAFIAQQKANFEKLGEMEIALPAAEEGQPAQAMTFNSQYTEKAMVIDGVSVDQFQVKMVLPPEMMQQFGPMAMLIGNAGTGGYLAAKDRKVLISTVTDPQLITQGLKALGQQDGAGSGGGIARVRDHLPENASLEMFISIDGIAQTANPFLLMFSPDGQQLEVPADLPPLAMGGASDGKGVALRMFIPHALVSFALESYEKLAPLPQDGGDRDGPPRAPRAY